MVLFPGERLVAGGGISLGRNLALGLPKSHQPRLGSDIPVYPNTAFLQYGWIHLFADPRPAFCRLFSPTIPLHPYLFTRSMPPFRPPIDIITALSTFFPPLRYRSSIPRCLILTFPCSYLSLFSSLRSDCPFSHADSYYIAERKYDSLEIIYMARDLVQTITWVFTAFFR